MAITHILFSGNTAWGMYNFRGLLLRHFVDRGFKVTVLAPFDEIHFDNLRSIGCDVQDLPMNPKGINPLTDINLFWNYRKILKRIRPDMSITYTIKPNIYGSMAAQSLNIPYLPVTTGLGYVFIQQTLVSRIAKLLYRLAFRKARKVWFLNQDDVATFQKENLISCEKVEQLQGEGVDLNRFKLSPLKGVNTMTFLLIGRMLADKGVCEYVEAARIVRGKYPKTHFLLLGAMWKDNPAAISEGRMRAWIDEGIVEYKGTTNDVRSFIESADCIVLPSYREGVPCTLMEGAAMGRPLIATNVPGCREVVKNGYNGFLCHAKDVESLVVAMERMINLSFEERRKLGQNGYKMMKEKFDIRHVITQYDQAVRETLYLD